MVKIFDIVASRNRLTVLRLYVYYVYVIIEFNRRSAAKKNAHSDQAFAG